MLFAGTSVAERPNIVFVLVDDLGQRDLGSYGSTFYETVNLDRLAEQGVRFTDAYAACPVCSPTRASLMTGLWPQRTGITDYIGAVSQPEKWKRDTALLPAPYHERLELEAPTLAKSLKGAGYSTFFAGKWHLGPEGYWPEDQGFDVNRGGIDRGGPYGGSKYFSPYGNPRLSDGPPGEHLPDRLASEACAFIEEHQAEPFFVYLSFYSVHTPLMARSDLENKYTAKRQRLGLQPEWGQEGERKLRLVQEHAVYAGMVEAMDLAVGKVLDKLEATGTADNTLVIFTSDNGGLSTSEGWPTSNLPLRAGKGWMYEGGIRVPLIIRWPGHMTAGSVVDTPVSSPDFFPTLMDAAGVELVWDNGGGRDELKGGRDNGPILREEAKGGQDNGPILREGIVGRSMQLPSSPDGMSLLPLLLRGEFGEGPGEGPADEASDDEQSTEQKSTEDENSTEERALYWHYPHYGNQGGAPGSAIRLGRYKLIRWYEGNRLELYDLAEDIGETRDLAEQLPEVKQQLNARLQQWLDEVGALYPSKREG